MKSFSILVFLWIVMLNCGGGKKEANTPTSGYIIVKGSEEVLPMMSEQAYAFMDLYTKSKILVLDGGSDIGLSALFTDSAQVAMSTRVMSSQELDRARAAAFKVNEYKIAKDGIAVVVNPRNPVKKLILDQIVNIFSGKIKNWSEVSGADQPIDVCIWSENSGTSAYFQDSILKVQDYTVKARRFQYTEDMVKYINEKTNAVGMISSSRLYRAWSPVEEELRVKALPVSIDMKTEPVYPNESTIHAGDYPLTRYIYLYTSNEPKGLDAGFISFITSSAGQKLCAANGFVPITVPVKYLSDSIQ